MVAWFIVLGMSQGSHKKGHTINRGKGWLYNVLRGLFYSGLVWLWKRSRTMQRNGLPWSGLCNLFSIVSLLGYCGQASTPRTHYNVITKCSNTTKVIPEEEQHLFIFACDSRTLFQYMTYSHGNALPVLLSHSHHPRAIGLEQDGMCNIDCDSSLASQLWSDADWLY